MRTGFTEAWLTDAEDDSYDLSWFNELPEAGRPAIAKLRELLAVDPDPIDRHFQFAELETRLYHSRDLYESALDEYDETCAQHDAEMETICAAFMAKWGKIPLLDTYRQMAIRQQKRRTGGPANGGPNAAWLSTDSGPRVKRRSKTSLSAATVPLQNLRQELRWVSMPGARTAMGRKQLRHCPGTYKRQSARNPNSRSLSARTAEATSNACDSEVANQPSARHAGA
jgi:hypothetical protein